MSLMHILQVFIKIIAIVLMASTSVIASEGTHFIVLIDDSGDFREHRNNIVKTLPSVLFDGIQKVQGKPVEKELQAYNPNLDQLSLVFFALTRKQTECKDFVGLSLSKPKYLFHWETLADDLTSKENFSNFLKQIMGKKCRFGGEYSPIVTAESLILPFVQAQLKAREQSHLFSKTILLILSNDVYNGSDRARSNELDTLRAGTKKVPGVKDTDKALELGKWVLKVFHMTNAGTFTVNNNLFSRGSQKGRLVYQIVEVTPLHTDTSPYLEYDTKIRLDRLAIAKDKLRVEPDGGYEAAVLRIQSSKYLRPDSVKIEILDQNGDNWRLGKHSDFSQELPSLDKYQCENGSFCIPLFGEMSLLDIDDPLLKKGQIEFEVKFRYDTEGIYDYQLVKTGWKDIKITPIPPRQVQAGNFFPAVILDNEELVKQWKETDIEGLHQIVALERIEAERNSKRDLGILALFIFAIVIVFGLFRRYSEYPFKPTLQWVPESGLQLNFNQQPGARLLVGILTVINKGRVPMFAKLLKPTQPDRNAKVHLDSESLTGSLKKDGFELAPDVAPSGFVKEMKGHFKLIYEIEPLVSHKTPIHVFLATEAIKDRKHPGIAQSHSISTSVDMDWDDKRQDTGNANPLNTEIKFDIESVPESATLPRVTYIPRDTKPCYFGLEEKVVVGTLRFKSRARHYFAEPFEFEDNFTLIGYKGDNLPIKEGAIVVEGGEQLSIAPHRYEERQVFISCDGNTVPNPDFPSQEYTFRLIGEFAMGSELGPHKFVLHRDPTRADIELNISQFRKTYQIAWEQKAGLPSVQGGSDGLLKDGILKLAPYPRLRFMENQLPTPLFEIVVGNTGKSGDGWVKVAIKNIALYLTDDASRSIVLKEDYDPADLFELKEEDNFISDEPLEVKEGEMPKICAVKLNTAIIDNIVGARLDYKYATVVVNLDIKIAYEVEGKLKTIERQLTIHNPIGLEKLPQQNWLCIDFGTSAITAAIGKKNNISLLRLQKISENETNRHKNIADFDKGNLEINSQFLLPSYVACDADLRRGNSPDPSIKPGFPSYGVGDELPRPGDAQFLGLPATMRRIEDNPGRIIFSLKSWLSQSSDNIILSEPVEYTLGNKTVTRNELPLYDTVKSGFAALVEAYIGALPESKEVGQLVVCHPNTFSYWHQNRLRDILAEALGKRLKIELPDERIHLLSESDAVAYNYCHQRIRQVDYSLPKSEHILVYDFGAGTVDLSLVYVRWNQEVKYPEEWQVKKTLGVPIAGNYLDSILARLVDESLKNSDVLDPNLFNYRYPVVCKRLEEGKEDEHRRVIRNLWMAIRETKHQESSECIPTWGGEKGNPFCVKIGHLQGGSWVVEANKSPEFDNFLSALPEKVPSKLGIWCSQSGSDKGSIYLCIPANEVRDYKPMRDFIEFITDTVILELCQGAGVSESEVNTVVISGRGALWPGLCDRIWTKFPSADKPDNFIKDSNAAKEAVVRGAIAWQSLQRRKIKIVPPPVAQLGILLDNDMTLITADKWKDGIDLTNNDSFSLVQFALNNPQPKSDFQSLRRYLYIFVSREISRELHWENSLLKVRLIERNNKKIVLYENEQGEREDDTVIGSISHTQRPPWPIGVAYLEPDDFI